MNKCIKQVLYENKNNIKIKYRMFLTLTPPFYNTFMTTLLRIKTLRISKIRHENKTKRKMIIK